VAAHRVDPTKSPHFTKLVARWKKDYRHIQDDLDKLFAAIGKDLHAASAWRVQAGTNVEVYKYKQNSSDIRRGASYGWRVIALFDKKTATLYPILVWPKTAWGDAGNDLYDSAIEEVLGILGYCTNGGCDGSMKTSDPPQRSIDGLQVKLVCDKCTCSIWREQPNEG
jgi:hypothetical protein